MTIEDQAKYLYALGAAFNLGGYQQPNWQPVREREAKVGDLVMVTMMAQVNPIEQIGILLVDERVTIPDWGPVETWDPADRAEYEAGGRVGTQREWEIECLDGARRRYTNVSVLRLPRFEDIPRL